MRRPFDVCAFVERAAIIEFCAGTPRFEAEVQAARIQGVERWQAVKFIKEAGNAIGFGFAGGNGHQANALVGQ